jgi:Fe(3+) dicitrate transport protein
LPEREAVVQGLADAGVTSASEPSGPRETTVTAQRLTDVRRIAGSAQVIGREELERQEANDLHRVLQGVPGVYVREEDGFGLRPNIGLRGANGDRSSKVTLMEDGVLFGPAPYSAPAAYYVPMVTRLVGVEVFKGPASIRFGPQSIGGAINFRTRDVPTHFLADIDASVGNYGAGKAHGVVGWGTERAGVLFEGVHLRTDGFKELPGGGDTGFAKSELMFKARYSTGPLGPARHDFELKLGYSQERSNETYLGLSRPDFEAAPLRRYAASALDQMNWWRLQGVLTHSLTVGDRLSVVTTAYRHQLDRSWRRFDHFRSGPAPWAVLAYPTGVNAIYRAILAGEEDSVGPEQQVMLATNHRVFVSQGVQTLARLRLDTGPVQHELELGARFHHDEIVRHHTHRGYDMVRGTLVPGVEPELLTTHNVAFTRAFSAHVADTMSWGGLLVSPGARVEVIDSTLGDRLKAETSRLFTATPLLGVGAVYTFDFGLSMLGGVYQGFSPPNPGQVDAAPERALNSEVGLRYARRWVRLELIGFWSEYSNITGECTGSTGCLGDDMNRQFNGGTARVMGLEALLSLKARPGWGTSLFVDVAYTLTSARFLSDFQSENPTWGRVREGDELPYVPAHQGQVRLRAQRGPVELGVGAMFYGAVREVAGQGPVDDAVRVPMRVLLDATASVDWGDARFYATATNLANDPALVATRPFGARPQAPLLFQVGVKYALR